MKNKEKQLIQESQYFLPYHWFFKQTEKRGKKYFYYLSLCVDFLGDKNSKILDVGCGDGRFLGLLEENGFKNLYGLDYSEKAIKFANIFLNNSNLVISNISNAPFEKNFFDYIFLIETLEHLPFNKINKSLSNINDILKKNGYLILTVPSNNVRVEKKHFQHFSLKLIKKTIAPFFGIQNVIFVGWKNNLVKNLYRLVNNKFWDIKFLSTLFNKKLWHYFYGKTSKKKAEQIIVKCKKIK